MPTTGRPTCASRCASPGRQRRRGRARHLHRDQPAPAAHPRHQRHPGRHPPSRRSPPCIRDTDDTCTFHTNLNATHTSHPPHTDHPPEPHPALPTTPWHHTHHWITATHRHPVPERIRCWASESPIRRTGPGSGKSRSARTCCGSAITASTTCASCLGRPTPKSRWRPRQRRSAPTRTSPGRSASCAWTR